MEIMIFFSCLLFLIASFFCFALPGLFILGKSKQDFDLFEIFTLSTIVGFVIFTLAFYILSTFRIPFLLIILIALVDFIYLKKIKFSKINFQLSINYKSIMILFIFLLGIAGQLAIIAPSGLKLNQDLIFFSSHGHDGAWHLALMEEVKKGYPLQNPIFAGERLVNYHFFSDIAPAIFNQFFKFSELDLYFRFFPFLFSLLLGAIAYLFGKKIGNSSAVGIWTVFFVYFAGSFGYIVTWIQNHYIGGESIFWATQIQSSIGNPPQIISNILVLTLLYLFFLIYNKKDWILFVICLAILGSLAEFKIYAAIVMLSSLTIAGIIDFFRKRKIYLFLLSVFGILFSAIIYLPNSLNSASFLIWEPWWFIRTMVVTNSRLNWLDLELRRQTYLAQGNWKRVIQIELTSLLIFFFGNLGTRFLGLITFFNFFKKIDFPKLIFIFITLISLILPLLFLQKGVASNSIQFLQYFILLFGVSASLTITRLQNKIKNTFLKSLFITTIIILSIPTQLGLLYDFYHKPPLAKITYQELVALDFLKKNSQKNSIVLTPAFNRFLNIKMPTPFIWAWSDTAYVSAFSQRRTYLADIEQADIMGYNFQDRLKFQRLIFESKQIDNMTAQLKDRHIDYLYFPKMVGPKADISKSKLAKIFENQEIEIWKVN